MTRKLLFVAAALVLSTAARAQDAAPAGVIVENDAAMPVPIKVTNPVTAVTTTSNDDYTFVSFQGICNPTGGQVVISSLANLVPFGKRLVIDNFNIEVTLPVTTFAKAYIHPFPAGGNISAYPRINIPMQSQGAGFDYGQNARKSLMANVPLHAIMDSGWQLNVLIQGSDNLAAATSGCIYSVLGHYVTTGIGNIVLGQ